MCADYRIQSADYRIKKCADYRIERCADYRITKCADYRIKMRLDVITIETTQLFLLFSTWKKDTKSKLYGI